MTDRSFQIISRFYDGSIRRSWSCTPLPDNGNMLSFIGVFERDVEHRELGYIEGGTRSYEFYWRDRWYNIFRFHNRDGTLRNYYCNVSMPPQIFPTRLDYIDLDLDLVVWPDFRYEILDRNEFEQNCERFEIADDIRERAESALDELIGYARARAFPYGVSV